MFFLVPIFIIFPSTAMAYDGLFSILDEKYITSIDELPNSSSSDLKPDENWQASGNIRGWIDIVGYYQMVREHGINYVPGNPTDNVIVRYDVSIEELRSRVVWAGYWCYWCAADSLEKTIDVRQEGNQTIAILSVTFRWHETITNSGSQQIINYIDTASFQDLEASPEIYNPYIADISANITEYNNTIVPKTTIYLPNAPNITQVIYRYKSEELTHILKWAKVERTEKGVYFVNLIDTDFWTANTDNLHHINQWVVIPNSSRPDYANLTITVSNLYESRTVENASINRITYKPENTFSSPLLWFIATIATFLYVLNFVIRRSLNV